MTADHTDVPMDVTEFDDLAELLDQCAVPHGGMSLEALDGFFSALIVGPEMVMPSEYLPHVLGDAPDMQDKAQAEHVLTAIMRLWNHIIWRVRQPIDEDASAADQLILIPPFAMPGMPEDQIEGDLSDDYDPLANVPDDFPFAADWACGFALGMSLRGPQWEQWVDQDEDLQADIAMLGSLTGLETGQSQEPPLTLEERIAAAMEVPVILQYMHLVRMESLRPQPIRRAVVPGRNDPCPCGSGRKYKKCCGDGDTLH